MDKLSRQLGQDEAKVRVRDEIAIMRYGVSVTRGFRLSASITSPKRI